MVPGDSVVTKPLLPIAATEGLLLVHIPPVVGDKAVLEPIHNVVEPVKLMPGFGLMVTGLLGSDEQLDDEMVKVK